MPKFLCNVVETYQHGDAVIVLSDIPGSRADYRHGDVLELRRPNGSILHSKSEGVFMCPEGDETPFSVGFRGLKKTDVPVGSQVWLVNTERPPLKPNRHYEIIKPEERQNSA
jgi:hypothetical protein